MSPLAYRYRFDGSGRIFGADDAGEWQPTARMMLDGIQSGVGASSFDSAERDLLRVAAALLEADRLSPRRPFDGPRLLRELSWQRQLAVRIAVENPDRWAAAAPLLIRLLSFMTDDAWSVEFDPASLSAQSALPLPAVRVPTEVALFSGGLDSVAGIFARHRERGGAFLAVSACGNEVRGNAQRLAVEALREFGVAISWRKVRHQLRDARRSRTRTERSQRTRGLLFLAMGAAVAAQSGVACFNVYETGVGCINLPTSSAQVGAQGTRAMHPRTLTLFNLLLERVLDNRVRVVAPFFLHTKGELCSLAGSSLGELVRVTTSCDEGEGHKRDSMLHCGLCTSCLFRRVALKSAGLLRDTTPYRDEVTKRHGSYELRAFDQHARELGACNTFSDLLALDPDVRFAKDLPMSSPPLDPEGEVFSMYRRYAGEIRDFVDTTQPTVAPRRPQPRKESELDLFSAAR